MGEVPSRLLAWMNDGTDNNRHAHTQEYHKRKAKVEKMRRPQTPLSHLTSVPPTSSSHPSLAFPSASPIKNNSNSHDLTESPSLQLTPVSSPVRRSVTISPSTQRPSQQRTKQKPSAADVHKATPARPPWPLTKNRASRVVESDAGADDKEMTFSFADDDLDAVIPSTFLWYAQKKSLTPCLLCQQSEDMFALSRELSFAAANDGY